MRQLLALTKRHTLVFFKDKGTVISALITPLILILLYALFLNGIFEDTLLSNVSSMGFTITDSVKRGFVGGWEMSSILSVCCVTIAFVANLTMVQDKVNGSVNDLLIAPVKESTLALSYFLSTAVVTIIVNVIAFAVSLIYMSIVGFFLTFSDVLWLFLDTLLLCLFGTAFSSCICVFLKTQGAMSAVGIIISSVYGFICGSYYPISQFSAGIKTIVTFLPGTYGTTLFKNHYLGSVLEKMVADSGLPEQAFEGVKDGFDVNIYINSNKVSIGNMYLILLGSTIVLIGIYVLISVLLNNKKSLNKKTKLS